MLSSADKEAIRKIQFWRRNPIEFVQEQFQVKPDHWQAEALMSYVDPQKQRIAMKASKGPGKTCVLAWIIWHFMATRPHPKVATTSISGKNLQDNLWPELAKWQIKSQWLRSSFTWSKERIVNNDYPETWFVTARSWSPNADKQQQADTLAGLHAEFILFAIDEVGGIPSSVVATAEAALSTGQECKLIIAGNPTQTSGYLYDACTKNRSLWYVIDINGDPENPKRSNRVSLQWAQEMIQQYGRENPWVMVNVLGLFPPASLNSLLGPDDITRAMQRHYRDDEYSFSRKRLGIDVARFGDDKTVIFPRQGLVSFNPLVMRNARSEEIAGKIAYTWKEMGIDDGIIDDTGGYAAGVIDLLNKTEFSLIPVNFSGKALNEKYFNRRSEMYFNLAEAVRNGLVLPNLPELTEELTVPRYWFHNGKLRIEEKDQIKQSLGRSPDYADALALTYSLPQGNTLKSQEEFNRLSGVKKILHQNDYDPSEGFEQL